MFLPCSVVISSYNYARYLAQAIDSAIATGAEVVVVDDGSVDDSWDILTRYRERVTAIRQENKGQAAAINTGVAAATGEIILLLDGDDVVAPDRIERVAEVFLAEDIQWLRHDMLYFGERGMGTLAYGFEEDVEPQQEFEVTGQVRDGSTSGLAFRRSFFDAIGPIPEAEFRLSPDVYLIGAGAIAGGGLTLAEPLTFRRLHSQQWGYSKRVPISWDQDTMVFHAQMRASMARHAQDLARRFGTLPLVARGQTWWQQKWMLVDLRLQGRDRDAWTAWRKHIAALRQSPLPPARKAAEAIRSTVLVMTPSSVFPMVWWATHDGRSGLASDLASKLARSTTRRLSQPQARANGRSVDAG